MARATPFLGKKSFLARSISSSVKESRVLSQVSVSSVWFRQYSLVKHKLFFFLRVTNTSYSENFRTE